MAEGVFARRREEGVLDLFEIDSAGLGHWHVGQAPDQRAQKAAGRGIDISGQSARQVTSGDFARFDLVLAMDGANYEDLKQIAPKDDVTRSAGSSTLPRMLEPKTCLTPSSARPRASIMRSI